MKKSKSWLIVSIFTTVVICFASCAQQLFDNNDSDTKSTVSTPVFSISAGVYTSAQSVTITIDTDGATIVYTTDGSSPTASHGTIYDSAISVSETTTLKASAYKDGYTDSDVAKADYMIGTASSLSIKMISVSEGIFNNGTSYMAVSSFLIDKYEVTQAQYTSVMESNPVSSSSSYGYGCDYPVYNVSWDDAITFCNVLSKKEGYENVYTVNGTDVTADFTKNGYRLPTETEWEFAARGGNNSKGYLYSGSDTIGDVAWYEKNSGNSAHIIGTRKLNELGIYDMSGNVMEWCWDWFGLYPDEAQADYTGLSSGLYRVIRGGSWGTGIYSCRPSNRGYAGQPSLGGKDNGFRVARCP